MGRPVRPPMWTKDTSEPQIPQAATRTRASRGPGSGSAISSRRTSWGPCTRICFIALPRSRHRRRGLVAPHNWSRSPGRILARLHETRAGKRFGGKRRADVPHGACGVSGPHAPEGECGDPTGFGRTEGRNPPIGSLRVPPVCGIEVGAGPAPSCEYSYDWRLTGSDQVFRVRAAAKPQAGSQLGFCSL